MIMRARIVKSHTMSCMHMVCWFGEPPPSAYARKAMSATPVTP